MSSYSRIKTSYRIVQILLALALACIAALLLVFTQGSWACYTAHPIFVFHAYFALTRSRDEVAQCLAKGILLFMLLGAGLLIANSSTGNGGWGIPPSYLIGLLLLGVLLVALIAELVWSAYAYICVNKSSSLFFIPLFLVTSVIASTSMPSTVSAGTFPRNLSWEEIVCNGGWAAPLWVLLMLTILIAGGRLDKSARKIILG